MLQTMSIFKKKKVLKMNSEEDEDKQTEKVEEAENLKKQLADANSKISRLENELKQALDLADKAKPKDEESDFDKIFRREIK